jgi:hypothetical protein
VSKVGKSFCQTIQLRAERSALPQLQASWSATQPSFPRADVATIVMVLEHSTWGNPAFGGSFQLHGFNNNMTFL